MHNATQVRVHKLSHILVLPLRLEYEGGLRRERQDANRRSCEWLQFAARWIESESQGCWQRVPDLYQDLALFPQGDATDEERAHLSYSTAVYFHPFIRDLLFPRPNRRALETLEHTRVRGARIRTAGRAWRLFDVRRLHLFLIPCDILLLAIQLDWQSLEGEPLTIPETEDLLNQARRLYAPYYLPSGQPGDSPDGVVWLSEGLSGPQFGKTSDFADQRKHFEHVREYRDPPLAAHWESLLSPLVPGPGSEVGDNGRAGGIRVGQILDDRMNATTWLSIDPVRELAPSDVTRLTFLDGSGDAGEQPYAPDFLGTLKGYRYDRFWAPDWPENLTTRYFCCGYHFLVVASASDGFANAVVRKHFERHYFFLGLLAWLHKAALLNFWRRLFRIVHDYSNQPANRQSRHEFRKNQKWLLEDLSDFVTRFYFGEISNQLQPLELFRWWSGHLGTAKLYEQVMEQAKFLQEVQLNHWQEEIQHLSYAWLPVAVALAFLGVLGQKAIDDWFTHPVDALGQLAHAAAAAVVFAVVVVALFVIVQSFNRGGGRRLLNVILRIGRRPAWRRFE